ncbi:GAF domain-containing protein [Hymenobacter setariae]|uniref:GAF domain-containing protein n=1 Tax=Hymenobacter setariae TaxID=2594794 RepID=A0A558C191_9BACT|nr:GAF domain-containing protein [Hymenobacter setariae]TVT42543.1 GAF domain-containing protein [Hymenobacter setariae]
MMPLAAALAGSPNEAERLQALLQYDVMPAQQEPVFDELVRLAAQLFSLPISLIALVDAQEVAYKANQGLPGLQQQPREEAICAMVVSQRMPLIFTNLTRADQLQRLTPMASAAAQAKNLQFYAGVPLRTPIRHLIGTLCVIGNEPRSFSGDERQLLTQLAGLVSELIIIRHICLTHQKVTAHDRWQWLQTLFAGELQQLHVLVHYLLAEFGTKAPVPAGVLKPVARRLDDLHLLLQHHHPGPIWYSPAAVA